MYKSQQKSSRWGCHLQVVNSSVVNATSGKDKNQLIR